jgi:putative endonuclease
LFALGIEGRAMCEAPQSPGRADKARKTSSPTIRLRSPSSDLPRSWSVTHNIKNVESKFHEVECPELVEGRFVVYILYCSDKSYYVGQTNDLRRRLSDHRSGQAAHWTARRLPVALIYIEIHENRLSAMRREKQIKGWSRAKKEKLITALWEKQ